MTHSIRDPMSVRTHSFRSTVALLALALATACGGGDATPQSNDPALFELRRDDLPITVRENAELQALSETIVRSEVEGQSTIIFIVPEGSLVKQGDKVVELDVSELVEKRANQAITVAKADAALLQARKEKEILQKELTTTLTTAQSNLRIAEMELERLLGRPSTGRTEGRNLDMVERLQALVNPPPPPVLVDRADDVAPIEDSPVNVRVVDPRSYAGLVEKVYELLTVLETGAGSDAPAAATAARTSAGQRDMGDMANKILQQADTIKLAMADLKVKEETYRYSLRLAKKNYMTRNDLEKDQLAFQSQLSKVSLAWNDLDLLISYELARERIKLTQDRDNAGLELERVKGANEALVIKADSELTSREAEYSLAKERLQILDRQIKSAVILAPSPGTVVYARLDRNRGGSESVREGVQVRERQEVIILPDTTKMKCVVKVQEAQVDKVVRGQPAVIVPEAFQGQQFMGRVTSVAPVADSNSGWMTTDRKVYTTVVELDSDNPDARLRSRMAAAVTIMVDTIKDTLPLPLQAVERERSVNYVWKQTPTGPVATVIKVGRQNTERVEVLDGLVAGDRVYLKPPAGVQVPKFEQPVTPTPELPAKGAAGSDGSIATNGGAPAPSNGGDPTAPGNGSGNVGGDGQRRRGGGGMGQRKKFVDMSAEELAQAKERLDRMPAMLDGFRDRLGEDQAKELESSIQAAKKALEAKDLTTAQTHQDKISAAMRKLMSRGNGEGGGNGPGNAPGGGN
jgi:HlyD family secretion protein